MVWYIEVGEIFLEGPRKSAKGPWEMIRNSEFEMSLVRSKSEYYVNVILRCTALRDHSLNWTLRKVFFSDGFVFDFLIWFFSFDWQSGFSWSKKDKMAMAFLLEWGIFHWLKDFNNVVFVTNCDIREYQSGLPLKCSAVHVYLH